MTRYIFLYLLYISVSLTREKANKILAETILLHLYLYLYLKISLALYLSVSIYLFTFDCIPIPHISGWLYLCTSLIYLSSVNSDSFEIPSFRKIDTVDSILIFF